MVSEEDEPVPGQEPVSRPTFSSLNCPRIRDLSGIRIHQLTLPDALPFASKLQPDPAYPLIDSSRHEGYSLGESSSQGLSASPDTISFATRRGSNASRLSISYVHPEGTAHQRTRSTSTSTIAPHSPLAQRQRTARSRAPTLAGEALEQAQSGSLELQDSLLQLDEEEIVKPKRLARCFVVFKLCPVTSATDVPAPRPKRQTSGDLPRIQTNSTGETPWRRTVSRSSSTLSVHSPPHSPLHSRPPISPSSSRTRTTSFNTPSRQPSAPSLYRTTSSSSVKERLPLHRTASGRSHLTRHNSLGPTEESPSPSKAVTSKPVNVPFYISSVHHPSIYPQFPHIEPPADFANWLTAEEAASTRFRIEVWYEAELGLDPSQSQWRKLDILQREVVLSDLAVLSPDSTRRENQVELTFSNHPKVTYLVPTEQSENANGSAADQTGLTSTVQPAKGASSAIERDRSQNRVRRGLGFGGLHELVNVQAVITETERSIAILQTHIDQLLGKDADQRAIHRDTRQRTANIKWLAQGVADAERSRKEIEARTVLLNESVDRRRQHLEAAMLQSDRVRATTSDIEAQISEVETSRRSLFPIMHHWRSHHAQALDSLFPIQPLDPSSLLYSILDVPLPIPTGSKDPAPPLSLPANMLPDGVTKIDERTTAAALGYAGMVIQILGNLSGVQGGLPYPITGAGSRSLVKDVVSVMQGPRSFPLYAKGVERYRYEYAVFLLNKNVETLMSEINIRLLDLRHTLPNLKNLLLTLSSDDLPQPARSSITSSTYFDSRPASRQTSNTWSLAHSVSPGSSTGRHSPVGSDKRGLQLINTPSPLTKAGGAFGRRSRLSKPSLSRGARTDEAGDSEDERSESDTADEGENEKTMHPGAREIRNRAYVGL